MVWPTPQVPTVNTDNPADVPATARGDFLLLEQQHNAMRDYFDDPESSIPILGGGPIDLGGQASNRVRIYGVSGGITSFGANYSGSVFARTDIALSLVYNAATLITPGGVDLFLLPGDSFIAWPKASAGVADGWFVFPGRTSGRMALGGATADLNAMLTVGRNDAVAEGGQVSLCRATDNTPAFAWDTYWDGAQSITRLIDIIAVAVRLMIDGSGNVGIKPVGALTAPLDVNGDTIRLRTSKTPANTAAAGNHGDECFDATYDYRYIVGTGWTRSPARVTF